MLALLLKTDAEKQETSSEGLRRIKSKTLAGSVWSRRRYCIGAGLFLRLLHSIVLCGLITAVKTYMVL